MKKNNRLLTHSEMVQVIWLMGETHKDDEINQKLRFETIAEAQDSKTSRLVAEEIFKELDNHISTRGKDKRSIIFIEFVVSEYESLKSKYGTK